MRHDAQVAQRAAVAALRLRRRHKRRLEDPICPFELASGMGVKVRFEDLPSLEGMYSPDGPVMVIGSLRPAGRRAFTCAHELGHHVLGHGLRIDEVIPQGRADTRDEAEFSADRFAAALLMPKIAVERAFSSRGWSIAGCDSRHVYAISSLLGVGYTTLIGYLERTLKLVSARDAQRLRRISLPLIRESIIGFKPPHGLILVDDLWEGRHVDLEVGDMVLLPANTDVPAIGPLVEQSRQGCVLAAAVAPGSVDVANGRWKATCRVARRGYRGLNAYRYLEDPEYGR